MGLGTATRMAIDADFSHCEDRAAPSEREPPDDADPLDELVRIVSETPSRPPTGFSPNAGHRSWGRSG